MDPQKNKLTGSAARASKTCDCSRAFLQQFEELKCCLVCSQNNCPLIHTLESNTSRLFSMFFSFCKRIFKKNRELKVLTCHAIRLQNEALEVIKLPRSPCSVAIHDHAAQAGLMQSPMEMLTARTAHPLTPPGKELSLQREQPLHTPPHNQPPDPATALTGSHLRLPS